MRPDRDAMHYFEYRPLPIYGFDLPIRQMEANIRRLRNRGLTPEEIENILNISALEHGTSQKIFEYHAIRDQKAISAQRLSRFAAISLVPPFVVLELGIVWFLVRRRIGAWRNKCDPVLKNPSS